MLSTPFTETLLALPANLVSTPERTSYWPSGPVKHNGTVQVNYKEVIGHYPKNASGVIIFDGDDGAIYELKDCSKLNGKKIHRGHGQSDTNSLALIYKKTSKNVKEYTSRELNGMAKRVEIV